MAPVYCEAQKEVGLNGQPATADVRPQPFAGSSWWNLNLAILTRTHLRKSCHDLLHNSLAPFCLEGEAICLAKDKLNCQVTENMV